MENTITSFLVWLTTGPGLSAAVGAVLSILASQIPAWDKLPKLVKTAVPYILAALVAVAANAVLQTPIAENQWALAAANGVAFYLASQKQYQSTK